MSGQTDISVKFQAANIDEQGNVLYLDEERLKSKEMGYEPFKNHGKGLGIFDFVKTHVSARKWNWNIVLAVFRLIVKCSAWMKKRGIKEQALQKSDDVLPSEQAQHQCNRHAADCR